MKSVYTIVIHCFRIRLKKIEEKPTKKQNKEMRRRRSNKLVIEKKETFVILSLVYQVLISITEKMIKVI